MYYLNCATRLMLAIMVTVTGLLTTGCSKKSGPIITGKRQAVFLDDDPVTADPQLKGQKLSLPKAIDVVTWPTASGSVSHSIDPVKAVGSLQKVWSTSVGRGSGRDERLLNGPVSAGGVIFTVDTRGMVYAVHLETGRVLWKKDSTPKGPVLQAFSGGLAIEGEHLFVVTPHADIAMMDIRTGDVKKRFSLTAPVRSAPTVKDGFIYVVNINNQLEAINYNTGETSWSHMGIMETAGLLGGASPALTSDLVVAPYTSGEVYALHPRSGIALWRQSLMSLTKLDAVSSLFHIKARPVIKDNLVYLIGHGGMMMCLEATSGAVKWQHSVGGSRSPAVSGEALFMLSNQNQLICMNRFTGGIHWVRQLPRYENETNRKKPILWAGPILVNDALVLSGSQGQAIMVSAHNGVDLKTLDVGKKTLLSPIAVKGTVVFLTDQAELVAFR